MLALCMVFGHADAAGGNTKADTGLSRHITIHFQHGSKPKRKHKDRETRWFGGIHGGHVYLELDSSLFSFFPQGRFHIFSRRKKRHSAYFNQGLSMYHNDTTNQESTFTTIVIPINRVQYQVLAELREKYVAETPYDYAFFGMRCASAAYDVLGKAGIVKELSNFRNVVKNFYPKPMRRRLLKQARREGYKVIRIQGRSTRKWEKG